MRERKSKLLLFLSVDIIDSTEYKNRVNERSRFNAQSIVPPLWLGMFTDFYYGFPSLFTKNCKELKDDSVPLLPKVWKFFGDEIVFEVQITCHMNALIYVAAFKKSIIEYTKTAENSICIDKRINLKGCVWIAGFPIINSEIDPPLSIEKTGLNVDYIGPYIDSGFRLSKHSTKEKLVLAPDLALLIAHALIKLGSKKHCKSEIKNTLRLEYDGRTILKGVLFNRPMPVFWIRMPGKPGREKSDKIEEEKFGSKSGEDPIDVVEFCKAFISEVEPDMIVPYMESCSEFLSRPKSHEALIVNYFEYFDKENSPQAGEKIVESTVVHKVSDQKIDS